MLKQNAAAALEARTDNGKERGKRKKENFLLTKPSAFFLFVDYPQLSSLNSQLKKDRFPDPFLFSG